MENAVESMIIVFAVIVFVIALSLTTFMLSKAMTTTEEIIYFSDKTNYMQNIKIEEDADVEKMIQRDVTIDTVITSLYRYYKENFVVKIYNLSGDLVQIFDTSIEGQIYSATSKTPSLRTSKEIALINNYGPSSGAKNLFGAPWVSNITRDAKTRVDLYVSGKKGYINNVEVDYSSNNLYSLGTTFTETFIEYMYSGQTISMGEGEGIESITGNTKQKNKIVIEYRAN